MDTTIILEWTCVLVSPQCREELKLPIMSRSRLLGPRPPPSPPPPSPSNTPLATVLGWFPYSSRPGTATGATEGCPAGSSFGQETRLVPDGPDFCSALQWCEGLAAGALCAWHRSVAVATQSVVHWLYFLHSPPLRDIIP